MTSLVRSLDDLVRGEYTRARDLRTGDIRIRASRLVVLAICLGATYGAAMGLFGALRPTGPDLRFVLACMVKVPLLFLTTIAITFPSFYVTSALTQCRTSPLAMLRLQLIAVAVTLAVLASLAPVLAFFTMSTTAYAFIVLLNVLFFSIAGVVGLGFLRRALREVTGTSLECTHDANEVDDESDSEGADTAARNARMRDRSRVLKRIYGTWMLLFAIVGAQMAWILRPFIGSPDLEFTILRARESNFFAAAINALRLTLGIH
ncbi:MAG: hypothetical protein KDC95_08775 [Planctomycetes bacterium]|nr:hypothetical protein [Planctomycetota bacterium]